MPPFLHRLDFYGSLVELFGLAILLSYDVPFLQPQLLRVPSLRRRRETLLRLKQYHGSFDESHTPMYEPQLALSLQGPDVAGFLKLFPDWGRGRPLPRSLTLYVVHGSPLRFSEPWIFPSGDEDEPVATAISLSMLFTQEEREIQKVVYSVGFSLMLLGGILSLFHTMRG